MSQPAAVAAGAAGRQGGVPTAPAAPATRATPATPAALPKPMPKPSFNAEKHPNAPRPHATAPQQRACLATALRAALTRAGTVPCVNLKRNQHNKETTEALKLLELTPVGQELLAQHSRGVLREQMWASTNSTFLTSPTQKGWRIHFYAAVNWSAGHTTGHKSLEGCTRWRTPMTGKRSLHVHVACGCMASVFMAAGYAIL